MEIFQKNKERGFTVIEITVVVAIIGILLSIGVVQYRNAQSRGQLNRVASQLASDIRLMQQESSNDAIFPPAPGDVINHRFRLRLWDATTAEAEGIISNGYQVLDNATVLRQVRFSDSRVRAEIVIPDGLNNVDITYYPDHLDRTTNGLANGPLENRSYQIRLTHTVTNGVQLVNVDSRVGRVNTNEVNPL